MAPSACRAASRWTLVRVPRAGRRHAPMRSSAARLKRRAARLMRQRAGQVALAHPGHPGDEHVGVVGDPATRGELADLSPVELPLRRVRRCPPDARSGFAASRLAAAARSACCSRAIGELRSIIAAPTSQRTIRLGERHYLSAPEPVPPLDPSARRGAARGASGPPGSRAAAARPRSRLAFRPGAAHLRAQRPCPATIPIADARLRRASLVADAERSASFYELLGFTRVHQDLVFVHLALGAPRRSLPRRDAAGGLARRAARPRRHRLLQRHRRPRHRDHRRARRGGRRRRRWAARPAVRTREVRRHRPRRLPRSASSSRARPLQRLTAPRPRAGTPHLGGGRNRRKRPASARASVLDHRRDPRASASEVAPMAPRREGSCPRSASRSPGRGAEGHARGPTPRAGSAQRSPSPGEPRRSCVPSALAGGLVYHPIGMSPEPSPAQAHRAISAVQPDRVRRDGVRAPRLGSSATRASRAPWPSSGCTPQLAEAPGDRREPARRGAASSRASSTPTSSPRSTSSSPRTRRSWSWSTCGASRSRGCSGRRRARGAPVPVAHRREHRVRRAPRPARGPRGVQRVGRCRWASCTADVSPAERARRRRRDGAAARLRHRQGARAAQHHPRRADQGQARRTWRPSSSSAAEVTRRTDVVRGGRGALGGARGLAALRRRRRGRPHPGRAREADPAPELARGARAACARRHRPRALERNAEGRYPTARELAIAIEDAVPLVAARRGRVGGGARRRRARAAGGPRRRDRERVGGDPSAPATPSAGAAALGRSSEPSDRSGLEVHRRRAMRGAGWRRPRPRSRRGALDQRCSPPSPRPGR